MWSRQPAEHRSDPSASIREAAPDERVYWGHGRYTEYRVGRLPVILSAPHGGTRSPHEIRDRTEGYTIGDAHTQELTRLIAAALTDLTGQAPHVVISHLTRKKLDPNRTVQVAAEGDSLAERAWADYHGFIESAKEAVTSGWGAGLYLDIHGHGHRTPWVELGYLISIDVLNGADAQLDAIPRHAMHALTQATAAPVSALIRGPQSLGALLEARGYRAVPSPSDPGPGRADYFTGGYSTFRHGSAFRGTISAIQIEHPRQGVRDDPADRRAYARHLAEALLTFMEAHYAFGLPRPAAR